MIVVLADDFSGAAEIGGIGHRFGLRTEIQLTLDTNSTSDLIVLDCDTRSLNETEAVVKILEIATRLKKWDKPFSIFKKIDSVMRGHLIPELNALQECFRFNRILLIPANPARGRKIIGGEYFVNGIRLHETVFSSDPDFPVRSSKIVDRVATYTSTLTHVHVLSPENLPLCSMVTGDVTSALDIKNYVKGTGQKDLCCGAAELFEAYLQHLGFSVQSKNPDPSVKSEYTLVVNGSTVKTPGEQNWLEKSGISHHPLPGIFNGPAFQCDEEAIIEWHENVLRSLQRRKAAVVTIEHPVQHNKALSERFLNYFVGLMKYINQNIGLNRIHFFLTGGATASVLVRYFTGGKLFVKEEIVPGVVSLAEKAGEDSNACFTVKPGSYAWPPMLLDVISG